MITLNNKTEPLSQSVNVSVVAMTNCCQLFFGAAVTTIVGGDDDLTPTHLHLCFRWIFVKYSNTIIKTKQTLEFLCS